jgi:hypothetical protein
MTRKAFSLVAPFVLGGAAVALPGSRTPIAGLDSRIAVARNGPDLRPPADLHDVVFTPISVAVTAPACLSESLLSHFFAEAEAIWEPIGVAFDWHRVTSTETPREWQLAVTIENPHDPPVARHARLGWIFFAAGTPGRWIHLSQANAEALIRRTPTTPDTTLGAHESLLGRALGRAFSHEFGHYILKSEAHTPSGLMRATWPSEQLLSIDRRGFALLPDQREAIAQRLWQIRIAGDQP